MATCLDFELGLTIATLKNVRYYGVSAPDEWTWAPYSRVETRGDGRTIGFGYGVASWTWNFMSQVEMANLLDLFTASTDASVQVVIRTLTDAGQGHAEMLGRYQGVMSRPLDGQGKTMINASRLPSYSDVTLQFTHLESV